MKRQAGLDLLKILGCFAVVTLHVAGRSTDLLNLVLYYMASCAVPIFFMVNGNLVLNKNTLNYNYVNKKILNILFVIFLWNMLLFVGKLITKHEFTNPIFLSSENLIQNEYFWQFWFFGALIIIYLVLPKLHKYFKNNKMAIFMTAFFILVSFIIDLTSVLRSILGYSIIQIHVIQTFRIWTWIAYFLLGGLIGKTNIKELLKTNITLSQNIITAIFMTIAVVLYQYNMATYIYKIRYAEYFYDNIFTFIWVSILFILLYRINYSKIKCNIIYVVSNNIMGIYIIHVTMINIITYFYDFKSSFENIFLILIIFTSSLIISIVINKIPFVSRLIRI